MGMGMQVQITDPELQAKVEKWVADTGLPAEELLKDAMVGYFDEVKQIGQTLDDRYDEIKSGKVKMIPGDEAFARLRERARLCVRAKK